ncbi:hypothetical protein GCM10027347_17140 [Larkinella harenae]
MNVYQGPFPHKNRSKLNKIDKLYPQQDRWPTHAEKHRLERFFRDVANRYGFVAQCEENTVDGGFGKTGRFSK